MLCLRRDDEGRTTSLFVSLSLEILKFVKKRNRYSIDLQIYPILLTLRNILSGL